MTCAWIKAWVGVCGAPAISSSFCAAHQRTCESCGSPANHDCEETGQFVCGSPLCGDCEHTIHPEGHNGGIGVNEQRLPDGMKRHCKKTEQVYKPWYMREEQSL